MEVSHFLSHSSPSHEAFSKIGWERKKRCFLLTSSLHTPSTTSTSNANRISFQFRELRPPCCLSATSCESWFLFPLPFKRSSYLYSKQAKIKTSLRKWHVWRDGLETFHVFMFIIFFHLCFVCRVRSVSFALFLHHFPDLNAPKFNFVVLNAK